MDEFYIHFRGKCFISHNESMIIKADYHDLYLRIKRNILYLLSKKKRLFIKDYKNISNLVNKSNDIYLTTALTSNQELLDNIKGYPLDINQRIAVLREEDNTLVIAGAGSGKSLTIIGKVRYLIEEKYFEESDILCISFTNDSANSLKNSLRATYDYDIDVYTFHKLALSILKDNEDVFIAPNDSLEYIINEFFEFLIFDNVTLMKNVLSYFNENTHDYLSTYQKLLTKKTFIKFKKLIAQFIHLFKANIYVKDALYDFLYKEKKKTNYYFLICVIAIYNMYEDELNSQGEIDFDDMIVLATKFVNKEGMKKKYKHIIIDEYQDTSLIRCQLIQAIQKHNQSKLMAVGDDFQSIYRFAGCDLEIFLNFAHYFPNPDILYIYNTYRNAQELIDVAGNFIMKNKRQMKKQLISPKHINKPIKIIYYEEARDTFKKLIDSLNNKKILILGRNNNDINKFINDSFILKENVITYNNYQFKYLTVHRSKGLEEENVIIINLENNITGFPSKLEDDEILKLVIKTADQIPYEEERRLFYVALTRTKNINYLLVPKNKPSVFVRELLRDYPDKIEIMCIK